MLHLSQQQKLLQKLTPQQVQYLKLLQLPLLSMEQRIKAELELNPLLEEGVDEEIEPAQEDATDPLEKDAGSEEGAGEEDKYSFEDFMNDDFDGYKTERQATDNEEREDMPLPDEVPLAQRLLFQLHLQNLDDEEMLIAEEIIGNIDEDGYLRRELERIVEDINLGHGLTITIEKAERVLNLIQRLDPPGIAARTLQECLLAQLEVSDYNGPVHERAFKVLHDYFEDFTMKHFEELAKKLSIHIDQLKPTIELIQKLNPKPGEGEIIAQQNYILPDFIVEHVDDELVIMLNDRSIPPLRINKSYREMMSRRKNDGVSVEAKAFIRKRFEAAKWFIASIHQRRDTMLRVMRAIVDKQREFFETGENLRPMIYKDIAEIISMDISTISRVVNSKYVQTEFGVFELRHFFSDSLTTTTGEEVSNKEVKNVIKKMIEDEDPSRLLSDDRIAELLNRQGLQIARRTVAKYREQMRIPVARMRRKL
jgi:RNA polymerase sigma-54 factor